MAYGGIGMHREAYGGRGRHIELSVSLSGCLFVCEFMVHRAACAAKKTFKERKFYFYGVFFS